MSVDAASVPKRLIYLSSFEYPTKHAHPVHALHMARAFAKALSERFLFVIAEGVRHPLLAGVPHASPFRSRSRLIKVLHLRALGYAAWLSFFFVRNSAWRGEETVVFTNDLALAAFAGPVARAFGAKVALEVHAPPRGLLGTAALASANLLACVTAGLREDCVRRVGEGRCVLLPNAVDRSRFVDTPDVPALRATRGLPKDAFLVGYVGRFNPMGSDKGVRFMIEQLSLLPTAVELLLLGGTDEEIASARDTAHAAGVLPRTHLIAHVSPDEVAAYEQACDLLAYVPPNANDPFLRTETSPMKLYEYMASGVPIIASDLPTFRAALGDAAAYITPGSTEEYVARITALVKDSTARATLSRAARERVRENSWGERAARIIGML